MGWRLPPDQLSNNAVAPPPKKNNPTFGVPGRGLPSVALRVFVKTPPTNRKQFKFTDPLARVFASSLRMSAAAAVTATVLRLVEAPVTRLASVSRLFVSWQIYPVST